MTKNFFRYDELRSLDFSNHTSEQKCCTRIKHFKNIVNLTGLYNFGYRMQMTDFIKEPVLGLQETRLQTHAPAAGGGSHQNIYDETTSTPPYQNTVEEIEHGLLGLKIAASAPPLPLDSLSSPSLQVPAMGPTPPSSSSSSSSSSDRLSVIPLEHLGCPTRASPSVPEPPSAPRHGDRPVGILYDESMERHTGPGTIGLISSILASMLPTFHKFKNL